MKILFNKYEGTGNDFILLKNSPVQLDHSDNLLIKKLCDRRFGIGADGLILIEDYEGYHFRMHYFNADGSPGAMCGNGARCAAHFAMRQMTGFHDLKFMADDGSHTARYLGQDIIEVSITDVTNLRETPDGIFVNTGVPHLVVFTRDNEKMDMVTFGRKLRWSERYAPEGVNVNLVSVNDGRLNVRTYERGVEDETLSCGTGVTASAIAAATTGKIVISNPEITVRGGHLSVKFSLTESGASDIFLTGPATFVFEGEKEI
ncbi:MAG: diaminopimelate epimerase [Bacteroidales bacterium]|jgi:diaminopimelate epimerase|nr:diaminopimelate epimerase [Bacteroidales bacterium]